MRRDLNNGSIQDLYGPWVARGEWIKAFDLNGSFPTPSEASFDFTLAELPAGQYGRFMLLQDQPSYAAALRDEQIQEVPTETLVRDVTAAFRLNGVFNDVVRTPDGRVFRRVLLSALVRGVPMFHQLSLFNQNTAPCLPQTRFVD